MLLDDGSSVLTHAVVLATGVSYRQLEATGADELVGRGVYYGSASTQAESCQGDHVIIVGGANSAGQAAVYFSRFAAKVTMAVRGDSLEKSMSTYLIEQIAGYPTSRSGSNTSVQGARVTIGCSVSLLLIMAGARRSSIPGTCLSSSAPRR